MLLVSKTEDVNILFFRRTIRAEVGSDIPDGIPEVIPGQAETLDIWTGILTSSGDKLDFGRTHWEATDKLAFQHGTPGSTAARRHETCWLADDLRRPQNIGRRYGK
jgi:hypothetical protein